MHELLMAKVAGVSALKTLALPVAGGGLTIGAILAESTGMINDGTGIAIGFVGGILVALTGATWWVRGFLDDIRTEQKLMKQELNHLKETKNNHS